MEISEIVNGYINSALACVAVRSGVIDILDKNSLPLETIAERGGYPVLALERILRGWEMIGICIRKSNGDYELGAAGLALTNECSTPWRDLVQLAVEQYAPAFEQLDAVLAGHGLPFELAHGSPPFEYRRARPAANALFNRWLASETHLASDPIVEAGLWDRYRHVADIGGGKGVLLKAIAKRYPNVSLTLLEQAHVIEELRHEHSLHHINLVPCDFFSHIPVSVDLYLLKSVLHDWDDESAICILQNIRRVMPANGRLMVVERLLDTRPGAGLATVLLDLRMLAVTGGMERTADQYTRLLIESGFMPPQITPTAGPFYLLECAMR